MRVWASEANGQPSTEAQPPKQRTRGGVRTEANDGHFHLNHPAFNMASLVEMTKELSSLQDMFQDLDIAVVHKVFKDYEGHPNKFDAAVTELLTIHAVKEQAIQDADQADEPLADASSDAPGPAAFEQVVQVFPDLSRSVIGGALFQNQGQVAGAIELLINIGQDKDAIAQIRDMNPEKKAEVREDSPIPTFLREHRDSSPCASNFSAHFFFSHLAPPFFPLAS